MSMTSEDFWMRIQERQAATDAATHGHVRAPLFSLLARAAQLARQEGLTNAEFIEKYWPASPAGPPAGE